MRPRAFVVAVGALVFGTGATVGDVGGCGAQASDLDEAAFARARKQLDCQRCGECGLRSQRCVDACNSSRPSDVGFPVYCKPLLHDGEVCIHALQSASCADYATYVDDQTRAVPIECEFCRGDSAPPPPDPTFADSGR